MHKKSIFSDKVQAPIGKTDTGCLKVMIHMYTLPLYEVLDINHILTLSEETHTVSCSVAGGATVATLVVIFAFFMLLLCCLDCFFVF